MSEQFLNKEPSLRDDQVDSLSRIFRALSDESRLLIVTYLEQEGELTATDLCEYTRMSQPAVSYHLALLLAEGFIEYRTEGKFHRYRIRPDSIDCRAMNVVLRPFRMKIEHVTAGPSSDAQKSTMEHIPDTDETVNAVLDSVRNDLPLFMEQDWEKKWKAALEAVIHRAMDRGADPLAHVRWRIRYETARHK